MIQLNRVYVFKRTKSLIISINYFFSPMNKLIAIIQARMGSTRLPGKVMMKIIGKPIIEHLIDRVSKSGYINDIVVATSNKTENQELINFLKLKGIKIFIGDEEDVLSRYYLTAKKYQAKNIVRITADCPLIDYSVIDSTIKAYFKDTVDYTSNIFPRSFP